MTQPKTKEENALLWVRSIDTGLTPAEREEINREIDDALILFAALGYHAAHARQQSKLALSDREQGQDESAQERTGWVRTEADAALQNYHDLEKLLYDREDHGGPAGMDLFPEIKKAARELVDVAQEATARTGEEIDLFGMRIHGRRSIPEGYVPGANYKRLPDERKNKDPER